MSGISVSAIERDLENIWRDQAGDAEERAVTRARVLTLLVYQDAAHAGPDLDETIRAVAEMHPARALVFTVDRAAAEPSVSAEVTAACNVQGPRSKQVCCELVTFTAAGKSAEDLPSAAAQLLAPDVPVFLWWRAPVDPADYVFSHLVPMSDRVMFDSSVANARDDLARLARMVSEPGVPAVTDFTWQRLTPWREMFASFYDGADHRPYLERVDRVTIEYVPAAGSTDIAPRAVLFGCWLAERLGWTLDAGASSHDDDDNRFVFRTGDREIAMRFVPVAREGLEALLSTATLETTSEPTAAFTVSRGGRHQLASDVTLAGRSHASRILAYRPRTEAELLSTELGILSHDRLYEAALAIAGRMGAIRQA